jgi:hypothetical protein
LSLNILVNTNMYSKSRDTVPLNRSGKKENFTKVSQKNLIRTRTVHRNKVS